MRYTEAEYDAFEKRMHQRFPNMFTGSYGGFAVGTGWWAIIENLCENIHRHITWRNDRRFSLLKENPNNIKVPDKVEQVVVSQVKEKLGGLRFYYTGGDEVIDGMVRMAEAWAACSCEECGSPGSLRTVGLVRTLCETHDQIYQTQIHERFKK